VTRLKYGRRGSFGAAIMATALIAGVLSLASTRPTPAVAAGLLNTITGTVYVDTGVDGFYGGGDEAVANVAVKAYDANGILVGTATSAQDGTYTLSLSSAHAGTVRVEFETPAGYQSAPVTSATGSLSSIQFVEAGSTNVNYGVFDPALHCQLMLAHVCMNQGPMNFDPGARVVGISPFSPPTVQKFGVPVAADQSGALITSVSAKTAVGATWGLGYQRQQGLLWNAAFIRRHALLGPEGIGGVYVHDRSGNLRASFDLEALGLDLRPTTTVSGLNAAYGDAQGNVVYGADQRDIRSVITQTTSVTGVTYNPRGNTLQSRDIPGFLGVGMAGIGDLDVTDDGQHLWVTNLNQRSVHRLQIGGGATPTLSAQLGWNLDDAHTCVNNTGPLRPFGMDPQPDGTIVVAAVCTNEAADANTKPLPGDGLILSLNPTSTGAAAWATLTTVSFGYAHNYDYCDKGVYTCTWKAWSNDWSKLAVVASNLNSEGKDTGQYWWTQPMIVNVQTLPDGSFVLGISDRMSYQGGNANYAPVDAGVPGDMTTWVAGDTLLLCKSGTGWLQESGGQCEGDTSYVSSRTDEFFYDEFGHPETTIGGLAYANGQIVVSAMDPADYFLGGVRWLSATNGDQTNALNLTKKATNINDGFGKAAGVGDVEAICDEAPLQIGNRVWYDLNNNGFQDPDEPPVVGVTVTLYNVSTSTVVGTAITNDAGEYYFTSGFIDNDLTDAFGGGLEADTPYQVRLAAPADCNTGAPLDGFDLTIQDATTSAGPNDWIDSDAYSSGTTPCVYDIATVNVEPMPVSTVNHTYDIGFYRASVVLGDLVWFDLNKNGVQDAGEPGVGNVVLTITKADGSAVVDLLGRTITAVTTSATGSYLIPFLPAGEYKVVVNLPGDYVTTTGTSELQLTVMLNLGDRVRTLDFGLYSETEAANFAAPPGAPISPPPSPGVVATGSVSVGDYVWWDTNADGRQDATDVPLAGVVLTITTADGGPVTDINGNPVTSTTTNAQGWYTFDNLPYGEYRVTVTPPAGFTPTLANVGSTDKDSSTGFAVSRNLTTSGDRDPTLDFGFVANGVSVGNFVWFDANNNGIQDGGEQPIAGAVLSITDMNGNPVRDLAGRLVGPQTTGADGTYLFTNLPPGQYRVSITYPPGFGPTRPIEGGDRANDSSTFVAVSRVLAAGQADLRLDFGMIPVVSVGDYVWWDTNRDGRQDDTDVPLQGVLLTITTIDGRPVFDSQGLPVTTTLTDANGWYTFDNLPLGQYMVCVTDPDGFVATLANIGSIDGDSSTGCATSRDLTVGGDRDPTLDFGYVALDMRLPATGLDATGTASLAVWLLGMGWVAWLAADRRRRRPTS
jgi:hypothetical protein